MQVDFAYNSNRIEGNCLTYEQTRYIFETHTIGGTASVNDVFETANHFRCFDYILDTIDEPISEKLIKELHRKLKSGIITDDDSAVVGDYKKYPNTVGEITTTLPEEVSGAVRALIEEFSHRNAICMMWQSFMPSLKKYTLFMTVTVVSAGCLHLKCVCKTA